MVWCLSDLASSCTASIGQGDVIILVGPLWEFWASPNFMPGFVAFGWSMSTCSLGLCPQGWRGAFDVTYGSTLQIDWKHITLPEANITPETLLEDEFPTVKIGFLAGAR